MSRIGKKVIVLPKGVTIDIKGSAVKVKGPKGELSRTFSPVITIEQKDGEVNCIRPSEERQIKALHGTTRAVLNNMVVGVSTGFSKALQVEGVGYRAEMKGKKLVMALGFSHPVEVEPPDGISFTVEEKTRVITISGTDREQVGQVAANIRAWRPPEPYKGKGLRYVGEIVRRKAGKAGKVG
ncbi:MAG: 50S ribosomal protein L6 [Anaerolineales bacterium]|nr:50S ribosomal protein L6 [Anaerolineales bacterium]